MTQFIGVFRHEFNMSIRRKGLWIGNAIVIGLFVAAMLSPQKTGPDGFFSGNPPLQETGNMVYMFNMLIPLVAGILSSDRLQRDYRLGIRELQSSTAIKSGVYLAGKYFGSVISTLVPFFVTVVFLGLYAVFSGRAPIEVLEWVLLAFITIAIPTFVFVVAFSLVCPLFLPVRVYQILFTGYWFWGNFLNEKVFPTISGTILNSSGIYSLQGFFNGTISRTGESLHTPIEALLNITVLFICAAIVLYSGYQYIAWQNRKV